MGETNLFTGTQMLLKIIEHRFIQVCVAEIREWCLFPIRDLFSQHTQGTAMVRS